MSRRRRIRLQACAIVMLFAALPLPADAATLFDPALRFRWLPTEHFVIYFHQGGERMARRVAAIAEETWQTLQQPLGVTPPRRTHVVLADQTELANGYATPLPYDTIVINPVWPPGTDFYFDDWLRLAFTHEFTHIVHLDRSESWARVLRSVFGRTAFAFPNLFLPAWQIEGLATYEESVITGIGRLHAGDFRAIVDEAARARRLEPLDRVNGGLTDWPDGAAVYAYGSGFHQYLADRYGARTLADLATATARRVPYTASRAFARVYGQPLGALWREYESSVAARATMAASAHPSPAPTRLTRQGFSVRGPRFDRFPCAGCAPDILYSASNADGFPALYRVGAGGGAPRRVTTRYLGSTTAIGRDVVYFDQLEIRRNVGAYSDLYALSRADGRVRALTREARLLDPDLAPDGDTIVCVQDRPGQRNLVTVHVPTLAITTLIAESDTQFDAPKWSPDGRRIAVERHRLGAMPEIVVVDAGTKAVRVIAADATTRFAMPAWRPDGAAIVAAAAPEEQTFNLVELPLDGAGPRQLTSTTGGATWPDVSPDGQTLVYVGYTPDGFDLFTIPYPPAVTSPDDWRLHIASSPDDRQPRMISPSAGGSDGGRETSGTPKSGAVQPPQVSPAPTSAYSPLPTLTPTSWFPVIETDSDQVRVGASVGGVDVLGYHAWVASATWLVSAPADAVTPRAASPDWQAYYTYDRWRPRFFLASSNQTSFFAGPASDAGTPTAATRRERQLEGGVVFPIRHARARHAGLLSILRSVDDFTLAEGAIAVARTPLHAAWQTITSRTYGYSISREHGLAAGATAELVRRGLGSAADSTTVTGDVRAYLPALAPHHVVALRVSGGVSRGDPTVGRTFRLGGNAPAAEVADFGSSAFSLLRGFRANTFAGTRVSLVNAEYRWPIARPQRGIGTWPIFVHSIHGAVFADAGRAWTPLRSSAIKTSAGAQLSADFVAGYFAPFTATAGAAWGHDGSGLVRDRLTAYFRVGKAF